jgi:hypothetical protein
MQRLSYRRFPAKRNEQVGTILHAIYQEAGPELPIGILYSAPANLSLSLLKPLPRRA